MTKLAPVPSMGTGSFEVQNMEFREFPKMPRLSRDMVITEKLDGTNAQVYVGKDGTILAGSRTRWITPQDDNYGFAKWVEDHREELLTLGPGPHFGNGGGAGHQPRLRAERAPVLDVQRATLVPTRARAAHLSDAGPARVQGSGDATTVLRLGAGTVRRPIPVRTY